MERNSDIRSGVFLSDLHLFSRRSANLDVSSLVDDYRRADQCIILGGDIFDFRWSTIGDLESTFETACTWFEELLANTGDCQVVFLPGNHDCQLPFLNRVQQIAATNQRFTVHQHHLRLADCLFLHGDILDAGTTLEDLERYRRKFDHAQPKPSYMHRLYDVAVALRMHRIIPRYVHLPRATCERLVRTLENLEAIDVTGVRRVFFGHTHVAIDGFKLADRCFFNPGAGLKHMRIQPHPFEIS